MKRVEREQRNSADVLHVAARVPDAWHAACSKWWLAVNASLDPAHVQGGTGIDHPFPEFRGFERLPDAITRFAAPEVVPLRAQRAAQVVLAPDTLMQLI